MKIVTVFLAIVVLLTLTSCGKEEVEVTRVVKETVVEQVEVTPVFDAEAEEETVMAASEALNDAYANADREAALALLHEDWTWFVAFPEVWRAYTFQDIRPDWWTVPEFYSWDEYEVIVAPDLAVIRGDLTGEVPEIGPVKLYQTSVFKKEDGQWKFIHGHSSYGGP